MDNPFMPGSLTKTLVTENACSTQARATIQTQHSYMNSEDQIKALAELDGAKSDWYCVKCGAKHTYPSSDSYRKYCNGTCNMITSHNPRFKPYVTSYDAIIPLIQKQSDLVKATIEDFLMPKMSCSWYDATSYQLSEALLRATNKWKD